MGIYLHGVENSTSNMHLRLNVCMHLVSMVFV